MPITTSILLVTTSSTADEESNTAGTPATSMVAIIAGTVAGAIVLIISLLILISVVVYLMKKKKQASLSLQTTPITTGHLNSHAVAAIEMEQNQAYVTKETMTRPLHTVDNEANGHHTFYVNPISTEQAFENEDDEAYTDIDIHTSTPESQEHTYDYI